MSWSNEDLIQAWNDGIFNNLVFKEIQEGLHTKEMELIGAETKALVSRNQELGGSEHGFYFKSELFIVEGAYGKTGIEILHPSLEKEAEYLRLNRTEVQQHTTYIAQMLGALETVCAGNPSTFCVNVPRGLLQISDSLNRLDLFCQKNDTDFYNEAKFDPGDPSKAAYFAHFNRVDEPISRFLFRRVMN